MNKLLDRYLFKELLFFFIIALCGFIIIGLVDVLFSLLDYVVNRGVSFSVVNTLLVYKIPSIIILFMPIASLFAVMMVAIRMTSDLELIVLWTAGIKQARVLRPMLIFVLLAALFSFVLSEWIEPVTNYRSNNLIHKVILKESIPNIQENVFFKDVGDRFFYIRSIEERSNTLRDIMIYDLEASYPRMITSKFAKWYGDYWELQNGKIYKYSRDGFLEFEAGFESLRIKVNYDLNNNYQKVRNTKEMSSREIATKIKAYKESGLDHKKMQVEYYLKYSLPMANVVFGVLGALLVMVLVRTKKEIWGIVSAIVVALLGVAFFFFLSAFFRALGIGGKVSPLVAAWGPLVLYILMGWGIYLIKKLSFRV